MVIATRERAGRVRMVGKPLSIGAASPTIALLASSASERHGARPAARFKRDGKWQDRTFAELGETIESLARGLVAIGLRPGDRVCILAGTRVEWTCASLAIARAGCVLVPIYPTSPSHECRGIVRDAGARAIICDGAEQLAKVAQARSSLPELATWIVFDADAQTAGALSLEELRERGRGVRREELERRARAVGPDDICSIIYTSGTTGPPKGVVLSHRGCSSIGPMVQQLGIATRSDVAYLFLPLAHVLAQTVQLAAFHIGVPLVYFGGDAQQIVAELCETRPTYFPSVPRIFERIHTLATAALDDATTEDRERFAQDIELGVRVREFERRGERVPAAVRAAFDEADVRLYTNVRALFGGSLREAVTGAAPIAPEILEFFFACGVLVLEGWGMTETTGLACLGTRHSFKFGTVGKPVPGLEVEIAEDGEILVRGPSVFREYWRNPEATRAAFTEQGWLRTGDIGAIDADGFLSITGRKKDVVITAGGKKIAPAKIEDHLRQSRWISQAVLFADRKPYPVALVTLDPEQIVPWARARGLPEDVAELASEPAVRDMIQAEIDRTNANYAPFGQIKRFAILPQDLTPEADELTITMKVKRNVVYVRYADTFESLYRR